MLAQILAILIFLAMFILIVVDKIERHIVTVVCGFLVTVVVFGLCMNSLDAIRDVLNIQSVFKIEFWYNLGASEESSIGINWSTIIFIAGMMVMVEGMGEVGFFRWLCLNIAKIVNYRVIPILITFMIMSGFLAMFIDSITVILFLVAVTIELANLLKFNPVPIIISEIFCANLGGSATMCGDPPNIIIGTSLGYTFGDFITNTGIIALISMVVIIFYFYMCFRNQLKGCEVEQIELKEYNLQTANSGCYEVEYEDMSHYPNPKDAITDKKGFIISSIIFGIAVLLLITHAQTGFTVAFIGLFVAILTLIASGKKAFSLIKKVDYKTILFFIGLFVVVGGLEKTGILEMIAEFIGKVSGGNIKLMIAIIIWVSGIASAFVDNIPFAATMIPVIKTLAISQGVPLSTLAWTLSMGTDIGGSATPIGASANVVGTSVSEKEGYSIGWKDYCKYSFPSTIIVLTISMIYIFIKYL
ncbi:MAG: SLC13 family permease [Intestinibacter sp.]|uniref:SLC13 family permease n=1 Tax=Intestinibacter sp. TaxID=1965304 RepID=UPI003F152B46